MDIFGERRANQKLASLSTDKTALKQKIYQAQIELAVKYVWSQLAIAELEKNIVNEQLRVSQENLQAIIQSLPSDTVEIKHIKLKSQFHVKQKHSLSRNGNNQR